MPTLRTSKRKKARQRSKASKKRSKKRIPSKRYRSSLKRTRPSRDSVESVESVGSSYYNTALVSAASEEEHPLEIEVDISKENFSHIEERGSDLWAIYKGDPSGHYKLNWIPTKYLFMVNSDDDDDGPFYSLCFTVPDPNDIEAKGFIEQDDLLSDGSAIQIGEMQVVEFKTLAIESPPHLRYKRGHYRLIDNTYLEFKEWDGEDQQVLRQRIRTELEKRKRELHEFVLNLNKQ